MGCMVDMNEHTMIFTLNGEILLDDSGSELAFKDFDVGDGKRHGFLSFVFAVQCRGLFRGMASPNNRFRVSGHMSCSCKLLSAMRLIRSGTEIISAEKTSISLREGFDEVEMSVRKMKQIVGSDMAPHSIDFSFWIPLVHQQFTAFFFFVH